MHVCKNCKENISAERPESTGSFPAYTVLGSAVGTFGAAVSGMWLLVPAAIVAGAAADVIGQRCRICDHKIKDDEQGFCLMEKLDDGVGGRSYRPLTGPSSPACGAPRQSRSHLSDQRHRSSWDAKAVEASNSFGASGNGDARKAPDEFLLDDATGTLVQRDLPAGEASDPDQSFAGLDSKEDLGIDLFPVFEFEDQGEAAIAEDLIGLADEPVDLFSPEMPDEPLDGGL